MEKAEWILNGNIQSIKVEKLCETSVFSNYLFFDSFTNWPDCSSLCPRISMGGKIPSITNMSDSRHLIDLFKTMSHKYASDPSKKLMIRSSFLYEDDQQFVDYNSRSAMPSGLWQPGQPNGGSAQQCTIFQILNW